MQLGQSGVTPTFFAQTGGCRQTESGGAQIWKYTGTGSGATWTRIDNNGLSGGISVFAVDPTNPSRLYAANLAPAESRASALLGRCGQCGYFVRSRSSAW